MATICSSSRSDRDEGSLNFYPKTPASEDAGYNNAHLLLLCGFALTGRRHAAIEVIHRARDSFRHDHFHGLRALFDFLGDEIFFIAADLPEPVFLQIAPEFGRRH